jgi:hypothetical protein
MPQGNTLFNRTELATIKSLREKQEHIKKFKEGFINKEYENSQGIATCNFLSKIGAVVFFITFVIAIFLVTQNRFAISEKLDVIALILVCFYAFFMLIMTCKTFFLANIKMRFVMLYPEKEELLAIKLDHIRLWPYCEE